MQASSPTKHRARLCRVCGISPPQGGNAPLRLRLAAHPPSGLRCPHRTARAEARLCSATVKPAPSRFLRRRWRSTPQPLAGEAVKPPLERLPCKGSWRRQPTEGCRAWLCQYPSGSPQAFPALRHYRTPRCGAYTKPQRHPFALPGGRKRPPYNIRQMGGITGATCMAGRWRLWSAAVPCAGADDFHRPAKACGTAKSTERCKNCPPPGPAGAAACGQAPVHVSL